MSTSLKESGLELRADVLVIGGGPGAKGLVGAYRRELGWGPGRQSTASQSDVNLTNSFRHRGVRPS